jgi:hypothetical protein
MDADERELLAKTLGHATAHHTAAALDAALDDLGWREALAADPRTAVSTLFELQGAAGSTSSALDDVLVAALGLDPSPTVAVVLPPLGRCDPPGTAVGTRVTVAGLGTSGLPRRDRAVVVTRAPGSDNDGDGEGCAVILTGVGDLRLRAVHGLDPALGVVEVAGVVAPVPGTERAVLPSGTWPAALAAGQRALAHELVGASRAMLELARGHALDRVQFGRPIAGFQAVRHRLAEGLVAIEGADATLAAAWDDGSPLAAALAKAVAGRSARTVARHAQQVLAGIGFTTEHPLHRYVRRVVVLDHLLGDARSLTRRLGADLLDHRAVPSMLPL